MKKTIYLILSLMLTASCIYPFEPESVATQQRLVFEGDIIVGELCDITVRASQPLNPGEDMIPGPPMGIMWIEDSHGTTYESKIPGWAPSLPGSTGGMISGPNGTLYAFDLRDADPEASYRLHFEEDRGNEYVSSWQEVVKAPEVSGLRFDYDEGFVYLRMDATGSDSRFYKWDYTEDWQYHAEYIPHYWFDVKSRSVIPYEKGYDDSLYWCWNHASSRESGLASTEGQTENRLDGQLVASYGRNNIRFQWRYRMDITVRSLNREAYDYLRNMNEISDISGDLFSPNPEDMRGNMVCVQDSTEFVIGYISAVQLARKRMYIAGEDRSFYRAPLATELFEPEVSQNMTLLDYYMADKRPVMEIPADIGTTIGWGPLRCIDCRMGGGTKQRPSDWPENPDKEDPAI